MSNLETIEVDGFVIKLSIPTPLEWLDLQVDRATPQVELICKTVSYAVTDWDGIGRPTPEALQADRSCHNAVFAIADHLNRAEELPDLEATKDGDRIIVMGENFGATFRQLTLLELAELMEDTKLPPAQKKAHAIAEMSTDWDGKGKVTGEYLWDNHDEHPYVVACDRVLEPFFRAPIVTVKTGSAGGDDGDGRGGHDAPSSVVVE